jgi:hypothetical protein
LSVAKLRKRCEEMRCIYINAADIEAPLPPFLGGGGYLIEGGAGSTKSVMSLSLSGPGSSLVEVAPKATPKYKQVTIIPVADVIDVDVFFFKLDVQGFEYDVLKGSEKLFTRKNVKTLQMEVYPRGLHNAGTDVEAMLNYLWHDLGLFCSTSLPESKRGEKFFEMDHPNSMQGFAEYLRQLGNATDAIENWGRFDDFYCFNRRHLWNN